MLSSPCSATPSESPSATGSECIYRSLTLVAMFLLLASLWVF